MSAQEAAGMHWLELHKQQQQLALFTKARKRRRANTNSSIPTLSGQYSLVYCTLLMSTNINELVVTM